MARENSAQGERDPECYCASQGLGYSCAASAGELCQQPSPADDLESIHAAVAKANIDPSRDILAEMYRRGRG
jgi:hypothetical protein